MSDAENCGADAAAYALGALEPREAEAFRRHLETCAVCRAEVDGFGSVVDALPMSAPQHPAPRRLRRRVMQEIRREATLAKGPRRIAWGLPRPALAGLGAVALVGAGVAGAALSSSPGGASVRVYAAQVGDARVRVTGDRAELIVNRLAQPGAGKIYEVWLERGSAPPRPTKALFGVDTAGRGDVVVPESISGVTAVLVTAEPDGGTAAPTSAPVVVASLASPA